MLQNMHTACCTLYKNKSALSPSLFRGLFSVRSSCLFFSSSQLVQRWSVCVCVVSPWVGGSALIMHGCAHLFDTGDASPPSLRPQDRWGGETAASALLEVTQLCAPPWRVAAWRAGGMATGKSVVQGAFKQGTEPIAALNAQQETLAMTHFLTLF